MELTKTDIENILKLYNLGCLKNYKQVIRYRRGLQPAYILKTSEGKFFLKQYLYFNHFRRSGLKLITFLRNKNYPCLKVFNSKRNKPYINYKGNTFAIFEFVNPRHRWCNLSEKEAYEIGKYLGKLHRIAKNFPIRKMTRENYDYFFNSLKKNYYKTKNAPKRFQKIFEYINKNFKKMRCPKNLPKSICHEEFFPPHLRFKNEKLVKVIDWDEANRNYMFYDFGVALVSAFYNKLNFKLLAAIIKGYDAQRRLTAWEKAHIFEAVQFGTSKFSIWSLENEKIGKWHWDSNYTRTYNLMRYSKEEFNEKLSKFLKL